MPVNGENHSDHLSLTFNSMIFGSKPRAVTRMRATLTGR